MIIRILGEGQYEIADEERSTLEELDATLVKAVDSGDEASFTAALSAINDEVRRAGQALAADAFAPSDLVLPFADATLAETKSLLADSGDAAGPDDR